MEEHASEEQIETISEMMIKDGITHDEQDPQRLQKYHVHAKVRFGMDDNIAHKLVCEALLYLKLKSECDFDPLREGKKFGSGFS